MDQKAIDKLLSEYADDAEICALIEKHAADHEEIAVCNTKAGVAIFRCPKGAEHDRFLGMILDDRKEQKVKAGKVLALATVVHPDRAVFSSWLDRFPAIAGAVVKPINVMMGGELEERGKE